MSSRGPLRTALVVGAARSGVALAQHLTRFGTNVLVVDRKPQSELRDSIAHMPKHGVTFQLGGYDARVLDGISIVFASPGVPWDSELLNEARARGIPVSSEIEQFLEMSGGIVVGITGTNGKTTTTALAGDVLKAGGLDVVVGGNIGDTVLDRLPEIGPETWVVLELSSFQLESIERPKLHVGVILNITPDHLDRHGTLERYTELKARAVEDADYAVLNSRCRGGTTWKTPSPRPRWGASRDSAMRRSTRRSAALRASSTGWSSSGSGQASVGTTTRRRPTPTRAASR